MCELLVLLIKKAGKILSQTHVYICGAKGISQYGGFESFVQKLLEYSADYEDIKYHVACKANGQGSMDVKLLKGASEVVDNHFSYCNADCFFVPVPEYMGSAQAIFYDIASIQAVCKHIKDNNIENPVVYILTCRIGPFIKKYVDKIHSYGGKVFLNPDGHEWARRKWSKAIRQYWKMSEAMMVKYSDHIICDNTHIENYINEKYKRYNPITSFIPYGCEVTPSRLSDDDYRINDWLDINKVQKNEYYLVVARFVEENNFDIIIKEFMETTTDKKLVILSTANESLNREYEKRLEYSKDKRIVFASTVYDLELLKKIREYAYAYIHGHEVGGTNPSLLEALASTDINLVLGVKFNREVAGDTALYWKKNDGSLAALIDKSEKISTNKRRTLGSDAKKRVLEKYEWTKIVQLYYEILIH